MSELIVIQQLVNISRTEKELNEALSLNIENITIFEQYAQNVGLKRKLESKLLILKSISLKISQKLRKFIVGSGVDVGETLNSENIRWDEGMSAFKSRIQTGILTNLNHVDPITFLEDASKIVHSKLLQRIRNMKAIKVNFCLCCKFIKLERDSNYISDFNFFNTENYAVIRTNDLNEIYNNVCNKILVGLEEFEEVGSGWALQEVIHLNVDINKYNPLRGRSYILLPLNIKRKNAVLNIMNNDRLCFIWAVLASMVKNYFVNVRDYPQNYYQIFDLKQIQLPMAFQYLLLFFS